MNDILQIDPGGLIRPALSPLQCLKIAKALHRAALADEPLGDEWHALAMFFQTAARAAVTQVDIPPTVRAAVAAFWQDLTAEVGSGE